MIYLNELCSLRDLNKAKIKRDLLKLLAGLKKEQQELSVTFCNNKYIKDLNHKYRKKNKATDVLSFASDEKEWLGDIVVSLPTARFNAKSIGNTLQEEVEYLLVHGLCHLLGHEHKKPRKKKAMRSQEKKLLSIIKELK